MIPIRTPVPRAPNARATLLAAIAIIGGMALLSPQESHSTVAAPRGVHADLGTPVAQIISMRLPDWAERPSEYQPLPQRDDRLNALLSNAVDVLTSGEAVASRDRLLGLQTSLRQTARELHIARQNMAVTPDKPCDSAEGLGQLTCHFATTRAEEAERVGNLASTIRQRQAQIIAERDRFASDLHEIGISIKPEQVAGLLQMATAQDIIGLHAAYANLREINAQLQQAASAPEASPADIRRYYGIYTVLLEVALHMHEDIYFKLQNTYLPRLDALATSTADTLRQARTLREETNRADLRVQLSGNETSLNTTLRAAMLYREALTAQAAALNASWKRLHEQHQVAVNSFRTASLSADLLSEMQDSGRHISNLRDLDIPAIDGVGHAALQREFERLTLQIQLPNG